MNRILLVVLLALVTQQVCSQNTYSYYDVDCEYKLAMRVDSILRESISHQTYQNLVEFTENNSKSAIRISMGIDDNGGICELEIQDITESLTTWEMCNIDNSLLKIKFDHCNPSMQNGIAVSRSFNEIQLQLLFCPNAYMSTINCEYNLSLKLDSVIHMSIGDSVYQRLVQYKENKCKSAIIISIGLDHEGSICKININDISRLLSDKEIDKLRADLSENRFEYCFPDEYNGIPRERLFNIYQPLWSYIEGFPILPSQIVSPLPWTNIFEIEEIEVLTLPDSWYDAPK